MPRIEFECATNGILQSVRPHLSFDQVSDDFRVGLGLELMPLPLQFVLELQVVLDDPVVNDDDFPGAVAVGVGILLSWSTVSRPPGVADAVNAVGRIVAQRILEIHQLAGRTAKRNPLGADEGNSGGVVAAVFHAAQPVQQDRHDRFRADVSDDSAHMINSRVFPRPFEESLPCPMKFAFFRSTQPSMTD